LPSPPIAFTEPSRMKARMTNVLLPDTPSRWKALAPSRPSTIRWSMVSS
jgi:hypothetical protein